MGNDLKIGSLPFVEILSGDEKGRLIELVKERLTIGRNDSNDIIVKTDGVSRNHASLVNGQDGIRIQDTGSKNGILVNGSRQSDVLLQAGDIFQIGESVFRFGAKKEKTSNNVDIPETLPEEPLAPPPLLEAPPVPRGSFRGGKRVPLYLALLLFLGLAYWYSQDSALIPERKGASSQTENTPTNSTGVGDTKTVTESIESNKIPTPPTTLSPEVKWSEENASKLDWSDSGIREAEQYFRKGARELSNQNYHRAIDSFQMALQIDKNHSGAQKYLGWSIQEAELEAKKNRDIAIRYYESLQYQRAIYYFQTVIALMAHKPLDPMVSQAEKYIEYSKRALEAADFFP